MLVNYIENVFFKKRFGGYCYVHHWTVTQITKEFPSKKWNYRSINRVLANDFVFMQDSAPSHRAKTTQDFFETTRPISSADKNGHRIRQI